MKKTGLFTISVLTSTLLFFNSGTSCFSAPKNTYTAQISKNSISIDNLLEQGKFNEVKKITEEILMKNPSNAEAKVYNGKLLSAQYKLDAAQKEFLKVLEQSPFNASAHNGLGMVYYKKTTSSDMEIRNNIGKYYQMALKEFETAINLSPELYTAYNNAGKILQEMGKLDDAEKYYKKALEIEPKYSEAVENYGTVLFAKNQTNAAISKYQEAIALNSKNSSAYYHLAEALILKGEYSKAIKSLQTSVYLFPNSAPVHDLLGKAYEMQGNEAAAVSEYKKSVLIKPEYTTPYLRLANLYQNRGDDEFAISELKNAVSINSDFLEGKLKIAEMSVNVGKTDQAIKCYKEILDNKNYKDQALKGLSKAYFMKAQEISNKADLISESEYIETENMIKEAINNNPEDLQLYLALLRVSRLSNKESQSDYYLSKIISNPSYKPVDQIIKGEALITYKKYAEAQNEFRGAINQVNSVENLLNLGEIFIINRQYQPAKEAFNKVLAQSPNNVKAIRYLEKIQRNEEQAIAKMNIAKGFFDEGQKMAAIEALRDCISLNPNLAEAQLLLAKSFEKEGYYLNAIEHYTAYVNLADISPKEAYKYKKKIQKIEQKVQFMQHTGRKIKRFTRI